MEWYNILIAVIGGIGGASGIVSLFMVKPKRESLEIENFKKLFEEAINERMQMKEQLKEYTTQSKKEINALNEKINVAQSYNYKMQRSINVAYKCSFPPKQTDCPVIHQLEEDNDD